jgi:hypothetical protein
MTAPGVPGTGTPGTGPIRQEPLAKSAADWIAGQIISGTSSRGRS